MSDYFQQPDEEEKRAYLLSELERIRRLEQAEAGARRMSPRLSPTGPTPLNGLSHPALGPEVMPSNPFMSDAPPDKPDPQASLFDAINQNGALSLAMDFTPVVGDVKGFMEAQSPMDYAFATAGLVPVVGDSLKAAYKAKKAADAQKRYERYQADTWTPGHRSIEDANGAGAREAMSDEFLDLALPEYIDEIEPEDFEAMSPSLRRLWKALERDDYLGFDRADDLMSTLVKADEEMLIKNFDLSPQLKTALGRYINEQYK